MTPNTWETQHKQLLPCTKVTEILFKSREIMTSSTETNCRLSRLVRRLRPVHSNLDPRRCYSSVCMFQPLQGDSGGPMHCRHDEGEQWRVVGVTSWGVEGCPGNPPISVHQGQLFQRLDWWQHAGDDQRGRHGTLNLQYFSKPCNAFNTRIETLGARGQVLSSYIWA